MAIHDFVDTITASISLKVSQDLTLDRSNSFSSNASQIVTLVSTTPALSANNPGISSSVERQLYVGLSGTPANNTIVVSIAGLYIPLNSTPSFSPASMSSHSTFNSSIVCPVAHSYSNPNYSIPKANNSYHDRQSLYVSDERDLLDLDWNSGSNFITDQTFNFSTPPVDSGNQGGNNQGNIKEFWA